MEQSGQENQTSQQDSTQIPFYNPWLLDSQAILEGIIFKNFTATKLKAGKRVCLPLEFEVFSSYVPENDYLRAKEGQGITLSLNNPQLFALREPEDFGLIICASSAKNIWLDLISMPIFKEDL